MAKQELSSGHEIPQRHSDGGERVDGGGHQHGLGRGEAGGQRQRGDAQ